MNDNNRKDRAVKPSFDKMMAAYEQEQRLFQQDCSHKGRDGMYIEKLSDANTSGISRRTLDMYEKLDERLGNMVKCKHCDDVWSMSLFTDDQIFEAYMIFKSMINQLKATVNFEGGEESRDYNTIVEMSKVVDLMYRNLRPYYATVRNNVTNDKGNGRSGSGNANRSKGRQKVVDRDWFNR